MSTQGARAFAFVHVLVSVSWLGALVGEVDSLHNRRQAEIRRADLLTRELDPEAIMQLDHDGRGVDSLEFVLGMLMVLGVELCGEPLQWSDVQPFIVKFRALSTRSRLDDDRITREDIDAFLADHGERRRQIRSKGHGHEKHSRQESVPRSSGPQLPPPLEGAANAACRHGGQDVKVHV